MVVSGKRKIGYNARVGMLLFAVVLSFAVTINANAPKVISFTAPTGKEVPFQGRHLYLFCQAKGYPKPSIWFLKNGTRLPKDSRTRFNETFAVIGKVDYRIDDGYYQCLAQNVFGTALSREILVKTKMIGKFLKPFRDSDPTRVVNVTVGKPLELSCPPHTTTRPFKALWGDLITLHRYFLHQDEGMYVLPNGNLYFPQLQHSHLSDSRIASGVRCVLYVHGTVRNSVKIKLHINGVVKKDVAPFFRMTLPNVTIAEKGKEYILFCGPGGNPLPVIKWFKDNKEILFDKRGDSKDGKYRVFPSKHNLIIKNVNSNSAGLYSCQATNRFSTIKSEGRVEVVMPPTWKTKLHDIHSRRNTDVQFVCEATGTRPITYHWYWNGRKSSGDGSYNASRGILSMKNVVPKYTGVVQCLAKNNYGSIMTSSYFYVQDVKPPEIVHFYAQAGRDAPVEGTDFMMYCDANGDPEPSKSYLIDGVKLPKGPRIIQRKLTLVIKKVDSMTDDGYYQCLAENSQGAALSNEIYLQTKVLGEFSYPFRDNDKTRSVTATIGRPFELFCPSHTYTHPFTVRWGGSISSKPIKFLSQGQDKYILSDGRLFFPRLLKKHVTEINLMGGARCILDIGKFIMRSSVGIKISPNAMSWNNVMPRVRSSLPSITYAEEGKKCRLLCAIGGNPLPTMKWYKDYNEIRLGNGKYNTSAVGQDLIITKVDKDSAGVYTCKAINPLGIATSSGRVKVMSSPKWKIKLQDVETHVSSDLQFICQATGSPDIVYLWFWNGKKIQNKPPFTVNKGILTIRNVQKSNSGIIQCIARSYSYGSIISRSYLHVED